MTESSPRSDTVAETEAMRDALASLGERARELESVVAGTMERAIRSGRELDDTLREIGTRLGAVALDRLFESVPDRFAALHAQAAAAPPFLPAADAGASAASAAPGKSRSQLSAAVALAVRRGFGML